MSMIQFANYLSAHNEELNLVSGLVSTVIGIFLIVANWKIFAKAGEKPWKCLIPFYNAYVMYGFTWKAYMAFPAIILGLLAGVFTSIVPNMELLGSVFMIASFVFTIISANKLSKAFGHKTGFTVGLVFLEPIFMLILGFGKSQYVGKSE